MKSTTCNGNALFVENKLYELYNVYNQNNELFWGELLYGEIQHFLKLGFPSLPLQLNPYLFLFFRE